MSIGLVGKKCGMSRIFTEDGRSVPVTLIEATPNRVTQVKSADNDGYAAVQVTAGAKRASLLGKPAKGHFAKAKVEPGRGLWEFRLSDADAGKYAVGAEIKADEVFKVGQMVDVAGVTKGKGFQGTIKRHNFASGPKSHGSHNKRAPGSIGASATPSRVFKGIRGPGRMGGKRVTQKGLTIVELIPASNLMLVRGAVPGAKGSTVEVRTDA